MKTRMEKYYDEENNNIALRQRKNERLYENINDYEVDDYKTRNIISSLKEEVLWLMKIMKNQILV